MTTVAMLKAWGFVASLLASGAANRHLKDDVLEGMAYWAINDPIIANDDSSVRAMMAIEIALAAFETGRQMVLDPHGSNDAGTSHCWAQIHLPSVLNYEHYTGAELRADPMKCARIAVRTIKYSLLHSPTCNECGLTLYARGRDTEEGRALSRNRMGLAHQLLRDVP